MPLSDLFKRDARAATPAGATGADAGEPVEAARTRARRRLIGAVVLLGVGVIAFPLLFETQPRPIPVDIPIQIPPRDGAPPPAVPAPRPSAQPAPAAPVPEKRVADAPRESAPAEVAAPAARPAAPAPAPPPVAVPKPEPKPPVAAPGRFVVQVGAFAEAAAVRDARSKVEKAGLATFTQVVETANGPRTRVRVGPFGTREEADRAAGKLRSAGLPASVLAL